MSVTSINQGSETDKDLEKIRSEIEKLIAEYQARTNDLLEDFKKRMENIRLTHLKELNEAIKRLEELTKGKG